jgi:hypothetical protein
MSDNLGRIRSARVRLVGWESSAADRSGRPLRRLYRPLIVGPAILSRSLGGWVRSERGIPRGSWHVDVLPGRSLLPDAPSRPIDLERVVAWRRQRGETCRVAAALVSCCDVTSSPPLAAASDAPTGSAAAPSSPQPWEDRVHVERAPGVVEIYGWALMYQLPGMLDAAAIDPHDELDDLPAFYNSPLELVDRSAFLAAKGILNRPIALLTRREDFHPRSGIAPHPVNRFQPDGTFRRPADLRRIFA